MTEMTAFEQQLAAGFKGLMGPSEPVDAAAILATITAAQPPTRRIRSLFSAGRFVLALVIVALFGGLVLGLPFERKVATVPGAGSDEPVLPWLFGPARNGVIVAATDTGLMQIDPQTGEMLPLLEGEYHGLAFSPDGRRLLFGGTGVTPSFHVMDADGSNVREVLPDGAWPVAWAPDGDRILAVHDGLLSMVTLETGDTVDFDLRMDITDVRWRPGHDQLVITGDSDGDGSQGLYLVEVDGTGLRPLMPEGAEIDAAEVSPDGSTIAYTVYVDPSDPAMPLSPIHLLDIETGADRELTFDGSSSMGAKVRAFSPDGTRLLIKQEAVGPAHEEVLRVRDMGYGAGEFRDLIVPVDGEGPVVMLGSDIHAGIGGPGGGASTFSPDGTQVLAAYSQAPEGIWLFDAATGEGEPKPSWQGWEMAWQRLAP